jgi:hypothetical protein
MEKHEGLDGQRLKEGKKKETSIVEVEKLLEDMERT